MSQSAEIFRMGILYCCINFGYRKKLKKKGGEYQDSPSKNFCVTVPKVSVGNPLLLHYFQVPKKFLIRGGASFKIFRRKFFLSQCRKISQGNSLVFTNFGNRKVLCLRGLYHDFLSIFFVSQCRKYWQVNPSVLCFRKLPVAKKIKDKRGGGEYQDFPSKVFCLTVPKKFKGEFFTVALISSTEKKWRREVLSRLYVKKFLSHIAETFRRGIFYCCIIFR